MKCQTLIVLCFAVLSAADDYEDKLTKLWSLASSSNDGSSVDVTSASIVIQPSSYDAPSRVKAYARYAFKPRAIPLKVEQQVEKNAYYSQDDVKYKPKVLFPGNYYSISKERSNATEGRQRQARFVPVAIPLIRNEEFQRRSLDVEDEEPIIEKPEGFTEQTASRRSLSDMLGVNDDDEDENEELEEEFDIEDLEEGKNKYKKNKKFKQQQVKKYMLPLLLAYKMKFFTLVPVLISGLVLLVGATGMAGFFFALFAAVMGLQKGGY